MNKALAFTQLDLRLIKPYIKSVLFLLGLGVAMGILLKSGEILSSYFMVMLLLIMSYPFAVVEKNNLGILYGTLTLNRKAIVIGRYLFVLLFALIGALLSFLGSLIITFVVGQQFVFADKFFVLSLSQALLLLVISFQYPTFFKYGYMKAKAATLIPLFIFFIIILLVPMLSDLFNWNITATSLFESLLSYPALSCLALWVVGLVSLGLSCFISYKIYKKKDL